MFVLLALTAIVAVSVTIYSLYFSLNQIVSSAHKELEGLALIHPVVKTVQLVQQHRGLSSGVMSGVGEFNPMRVEKAHEIEVIFSRVEGHLHAGTTQRESWKKITTEWARIQSDGLRWTREENFTTHTHLIYEILQFESSITDDYGLTADPNLDSFYLVYTSSNELLNALELLGQIRAYGTGILGEKQVSELQMANMSTLMTLLHHTLKPLKISMGKVAYYNPEMTQGLSATYDNIEKSSGQVINVVRADILSKHFAMTPSEFFSVTTKAVDAGYVQLHQSLLPAAERLIQVRMQHAKAMLYATLGTAFLLLLLGSYFMAGIYCVILDSIQMLSQSMKGFVRKNMQDRVRLETCDEFNQIGDTFNLMANELNELIASQQAVLDMLQKIASRVPGVIYQYRLRSDGSSCFPFASEAIREIYRVSPNEVREDASKVFAIIHPSDLYGVTVSIQASAQNLTSWHHEYRIQFEDGTVNWLLSSAVPERETDGSTLWHGFTTDITNRKSSEQKLCMLSTAIEQNPASVIITNLDAEIEYVNSRFSEVTGFSLAEVQGKNPHTMSAGLIPSLVYESLWSTLTSGQTWCGELINKRKNGEIYVEEAHISPVKDATGVVSHYVAVKLDVSERKKAKEYEQLYNNILELLTKDESLPSILKAIVLGVEQLNPTLICSILLLDNGGKHLVKCVAPSLPDFYNAAIDGIEIGMGVGSCGTAAFTGERVIVDDIETHPYWEPYKELAASAGLGACWSEPIFSPSGQVLGTFAIYHHEACLPVESDIATIERSARLASIAIDKSLVAESLRSSKEHYSKLFKDAPDAIILADAETGEILDFNHAFSNLLGWERTELIGKSQKIIHPNVGDAVVSSSFERHSSDMAGRVIETQAITMDGRILEVSITASIFEMNGRKVVLGSFQDITMRKQAEAELRVAAIAFESQEGIIVTDASRQILRVNRAFTKITGYSAEEVAGKNPSLLSSGRQDAKFYAAMWDCINLTGTWQGEIWDRRRDGEIYPEYLTITAVKDTNGIISNYVATMTDITVSKKAAEEIKYLAFYDSLTGLPNRRYLMDRLQHALAASARSGRDGALLYLDLDDFKTLNDSHGHDFGDMLLQQIAERLTACVREVDTVARLGGDEFVVMLEDLSEHSLETAAQAKTIGNKILSSLSQSYQLGHYEYLSTTSIGITLFNDHGRNIDELLKQADIAMYQAKKSGRNTLRFFDPLMQANINARVALEHELFIALEQQQFQLHYQIQVDKSGRALGAEVLIRWLHPERGMVSPIQFIPLAEETGLILPIGQWVLETACAQLQAWQQNAFTRDLTLSVNVSAKQFYQADFVVQVRAAVQRYAINPGQLKLELTESMLLEHIDDIIATMNTLKAIGIQFSLDDFGTGYSSLQYLKRLPLYQLKIDQSFVRDIAIDGSDQAIVSTIIAMANSLGLNVIAEGVETEEQRQLLLNSGCNTYQGYLFGKPVPIKHFEVLLEP